jgi:putative ribosome biogenesis GTPase RsgA
VVTFTGGSCTNATGTFNADLSFHPANAFDPLFVTNTDTGSGAGVLVPNTIVLNGVVIVAGNSGLGKSALGGVLTTCTFQSTRGTFVVTGILAPTVP